MYRVTSFLACGVDGIVRVVARRWGSPAGWDAVVGEDAVPGRLQNLERSFRVIYG